MIVEEGAAPDTLSKPISSTNNGESAQTPFKSFEGVSDGEQSGNRRSQRECPIPKPGRLVGEILGFKKVSTTEDASQSRSASSTITSTSITRITDNKGERPP